MINTKNTMLFVTNVVLGISLNVFAAETPKGEDIQSILDANLKKGTTPIPKVALIQSNDKKLGPYSYQIVFPPKFKLEAHGHPDERRYSILSGTWYVGWGKEYDESKLIALPAGICFTEPPNTPHFFTTKDEGAVIEVSGTGPSGEVTVEQTTAPRE